MVADLAKQEYREAESEIACTLLAALEATPRDDSLVRGIVADIWSESVSQDTSWGRSIRTGATWLAESLIPVVQSLSIWDRKELLELRLTNLRAISRGERGYYLAVMEDTPDGDWWAYQVAASEEFVRLMAADRPNPALLKALLDRLEPEVERRGSNFPYFVRHVRKGYVVSVEAAADLT